MNVESPENMQAPCSPPFWIISDTHFGHDNIIKYCGRPENHDQIMFENWKRTVARDDYIIHLGDLILDRKQSEMSEKVAKLPGRKILLKGNHDRRSGKYYADLGFQFIKKSFILPYHGWKVLFSHHPDYEREFISYPKHINVHGHIHEKTLDDPRYINVSVEQMNYQPQQIDWILQERIQQLESN